MITRLYLLCALAALALAETYLKETFDDGAKWEDRWIQSKHGDKTYGKFVLTAGKFYGDKEKDKGLQTSQDAHFYAMSRKFDKSFTNKNKDLVVQFTVKHEQNIDCGGGYVKIVPKDAQLDDFHGESKYHIMFGPDICGPGTKKVHVIFNYKGENKLIKKDIRCKDDEMTHQYTLIVKPDNTYQVLIDNEEAQKGDLEEHWDFLKPKTVKDPDAKKPEDWDEREYIDDPEDVKPDGWDTPEHITDPDAKKPDDWDDEMDGEWEPPMVDNPDYKGEWKPKQIKNPAYKGKWVHPEIDNPDYVADDKLYLFEDMGAVSLDLWQVKSGSIFDNIFVSDSVEEAKKFSEETFEKTKEGEKKMKEEQDEEEKKKMEEEAKNAEDDAEEDSAEDADDDDKKEDKKDEL